MEEKNQSYLVTEKVGKLMGKYAVPCIISLLVGALYNIVDQIFIANADYLGSYGNAANAVVFPLTVTALGIAVMIGDGCCAFVSISLGTNRKEEARKSAGNAILLCVISSMLLTVIYLFFSEPILAAFGGRVNDETFAYAKEYFFWITLGIPFLYVRSGDESDYPFGRESEVCYARYDCGCSKQYDSGSYFYFPFENGDERRRRCNRYRAVSDSSAITLVYWPDEID